MPLELTEEIFDTTLSGSKIPVLVDFWAPWCAPCRAIAPVFDDLAKEYAGKALLCKVNVEQAPTISGKFNVRAIPTLILFKNNEIFERLTGAASKESLVALLNKAL